MKLICFIFGHQKDYKVVNGWWGYSRYCKRCKKDMYEVIEDIEL